MRRHPTAVRLLAIAIFGVLATSAAKAQTEEEVEQARQWFAEGVAHVEAGNREAAVTAFRRVMTVRAVPQVRFNLAVSLAEIGEFAEADEHIQVLLEDSDTPEELRAGAADLRLHIEEVGGRLDIRVNGASSGFFATLDGRELQPELLRRPLRVRAGAHEVTVEQAGREVGRQDVSVEVGQTAEVSFDVVPTPLETAETVQDAPPPVPVEEERESLAKDWRLWAIVGGVLLAGVAIGVTVAFAKDESNAEFVGDFNPGVIRW